MVSLTLSIPEEIKESMGHFQEINWSGFVRNCIEEKVEQLSWKEKMLKKMKEEESFTDWAIKATKVSREKRFNELKKKGLV